MDVGRIVPLERQRLRDGQASEKRKRKAYAVGREVRERDNSLVGHPERLVEKSARVLHLLERIGTYRHVVMLVWYERYALVGIFPETVVSVGDDFVEAVDVDFHAVALDILGIPQDVQERAVAAADVYDARVSRHHRRDVAVKALLPLHHLARAVCEESAQERREIGYVG